MQQVQEYAAAVCSYVVSVFALFGVFVIDHSATWISLAGGVLLIARLIVEVPAAFRVLVPKRDTHE